MRTKHVVRLSDEEHRICDGTVDKVKGSSQKARRARVLRQRDVDGPGWSARQVAETYRSRVRTDENVRRRCMLEGFQDSDLGREYPAIASSLKAHWEEIVPFFLFTDTVRKVIWTMDHSACCTSGGPSAGRGRNKRLPGPSLVRWLRARKESVLRFLTASEVPFTNNLAEKDLRMMTLHTETSGCFQWSWGAGDFATARSVLSTARKQGRDRIEALLQAPGAMLAALCS